MTHIDIEKIIAGSNFSLLKRLPRFVIRWITYIIRQDEMNRILEKYKDDTGAGFLIKIIEELNITLVVEGKENLPDNKKCFFVANHPFGVIDGLVLTRVVTEKYGTLKAVANDVFMFLPQLRPLIAAVNVFEHSSREYVKALDETFDQDIPITHFPSGAVSRLIGWKIQDTPWQKAFISKAVSSKRDIVPIYIYGRNSFLFYTVNVIRRMVGSKLNIELMLLPREMFRKRNKTIRVRIGKPVSYQMLDASMTPRDWAQRIRAMTYELGS